MAQCSALRCVSGIWQNSEKPLISNVLRFVVTCLLTAALWVLFHQARHSFASLITLEAGVPIETISRMLGHSDIQTTQVYAERGIITITENGTVTMPTVPVWMTQQEMSDAFNVFGCDIRRAVHAIYKNMELFESDTMRYIRQDNGISYDVYSLEMVITIAFRLRTKECMAFRRFVMGRLTMNNRQPVNIFFSLSPI